METEKISVIKKSNNSGDNHTIFTNTNSTKNSIEPLNILSSNNISLFKKRTNYELMYEAFYISNLFYEMSNTKLHLKDPYFYLLNLEWFSKWKKYVNFDFYICNKNRKKFILLNNLPFRPNNDINNEEENYMKYIGQSTKKKINDFFDKFFLSDNSNLYPGYINNKKLMVDKFQNNTYSYNYNSENNFNVKNEYKINEHYIWVTEDIWKYFYLIYGGYEMRRKNLSNDLNNCEFYENNFREDSTLNLEKTILLEPKLKTFNLILFHYKRFYRYEIEQPKYLFIPHSTTILEFKKNIKALFTFLSKFRLEEIHLFYLSQNMNINDFADYMRKNNNCQKEMIFPGFSLDLSEENLTLELFEEKYLNLNSNETISNIVLEIPFFYQNTKIFLFKNPRNLRSQKNLMNINYRKPYYDKIEIDEIENDNDFTINEKLFLIKKFFYQKYFIDKLNQCQKCDLNFVLKKIITNFKEEQINKMFDAEINELRNNLDLIFDKCYLADNIPNLYLNEFDNNEKNKNNKLLCKKRERNENGEITLDSNDSNGGSDGISWYTCGYCEATLNQHCVLCSFCLRKKYCNSNCRKNDIKKHLRLCGK